MCLRIFLLFVELSFVNVNKILIEKIETGQKSLFKHDNLFKIFQNRSLKGNYKRKNLFFEIYNVLSTHSLCKVITNDHHRHIATTIRNYTSCFTDNFKASRNSGEL